VDEEGGQLFHESIKEDELEEIKDEFKGDDRNQFFSPPYENHNLATCTFSHSLRPLNESFDNLGRGKSLQKYR
jgi:hypothetical protein